MNRQDWKEVLPTLFLKRSTIPEEENTCGVVSFKGQLFETCDDKSLLSLLSKRGRGFSISGIIFFPLQKKHCHVNVRRLLERRLIDSECTGYAFSTHWVCHSWGLKDGKIVETTKLFKKYFGVVTKSMRDNTRK